MTQRLLLLAILGIAFLWSTRNWRKAVGAALVLLVFEGAIRKWVLPGSQQLVYFAKDVLLLGCYAGFWREQRRARVAVSPALVAFLVLGAAWAALEVFNPRLPNVLVGILGFKAYFLYVPLLFIVPACFADDRQLARFLSRYSLLAIPVGLLALMQFAAPASSRLNTYARGGVGDAAYVATFGSSEHVRVTGTFSFITGYTSFLLAIAILLAGLLGSFGWRFHAHRKLYLALALTLMGMLMTGSRGPVLLLAVLFPFYWYLAVLREGETGATIGRAMLAIAVLLGGAALAGGEAIDAFVGRAKGYSDMAPRIAAPVLAPFQLLPDIGVLGYGTGSSHQTAAAVAPSIIPYSWLEGRHTEAETGKVMLELGPIGFVLIYGARLALIAIAFGYAKSLRTRFHRSLATASFLYFLAQLFGSPVFDVTCGVYYWFFAGLMMTAARLDQLALREATASAARPLTPRLPPPPQWQAHPWPATPARRF